MRTVAFLEGGYGDGNVVGNVEVAGNGNVVEWEVVCVHEDEEQEV